jgi:hypothetical protein
MQTKLMIKGFKVVAILLGGALACLAHVQAIVGAQDHSARLFEIAGIELPFEKRVGVDDGAAFVVHFSGDTRGSLDTCG